MDDYCLVITATDDIGIAHKIAESLVSMNLAACVQIETVESFYNWEGKLQKEKEYRLMIKSLRADYIKIERKIIDLHNYDLPEVIVLDVTGGYENYLKWFSDSCKVR